jgi:hydrogenase expression/formation protein HypC
MCLAVPGRIESISGDDPIVRMAKVSFGGVVKDVSLAYVPEAVVGDYVIVHVGFALNRLDEDEARKIFEILNELEIEGPPS